MLIANSKLVSGFVNSKEALPYYDFVLLLCEIIRPYARFILQQKFDNGKTDYFYWDNLSFFKDIVRSDDLLMLTTIH